MTEQRNGGIIYAPKEDRVQLLDGSGYMVRHTFGGPNWKQALKDFNDSQVAHQEATHTTLGQG